MFFPSLSSLSKLVTQEPPAQTAPKLATTPVAPHVPPSRVSPDVLNFSLTGVTPSNSNAEKKPSLAEVVTSHNQMQAEPIVVQQQVVALPEQAAAKLLAEPNLGRIEASEAIQPIKDGFFEKEEAELVENSSEGLEFLQTFVEEISQLFSLGKELDKLVGEREDMRSVSEHLKTENSARLEKRKVLRDSLVALLTDEDSVNPDLSFKLNATVKSYEDYLDSVSVSIKDEETTQLKKANTLLLQINQRKKQISKLLEDKVGGQKIFHEIKKVISFCKNKKEAYLEDFLRENPGVKKTLAESIRENVKNFVEKDLHGSVMLVEEGDIIGILMSIMKK